MKVLVIGGGGREHAVCKKLSESKDVTEILCAPGNAGIAQVARCIPEVKATDIEGIVALAQREKVDFVCVTPDDPLALGCVDKLEAAGIPAFGPTAYAAQMEASKIFSKNLMRKYGIPTAKSETFTEMDKALAYLDTQGAPIVVKADGLALGKGVIIAQNEDEAVQAVRDMLLDGRFGASGSRIVIEQFLSGPEVSVLALTDGKVMRPLSSAMDHKRANDFDEGLNTGGMGTIAPNPLFTKEVAEKAMQRIFLPTMEAMNKEGRTFRGCLFFGLMIVDGEPYVIEYNCRFGDPETQVVLPLLESDLLTIMQATTNGTLADTEVRFSDKYACCVITASAGYPVSYQKGFEITMTPEAAAHTYVAGAKLENGKLLTSGGRVTGTTAVADSLADAIREAYRLASGVQFENAYRRSDIGQRALQA